MIWYEWGIIIGMFIILIIKIYEIYANVQKQLVMFGDDLEKWKRDKSELEMYKGHKNNKLYCQIDDLKNENRLLSSKLYSSNQKINRLKNENNDLKSRIKCYEDTFKMMGEELPDKE